jgi:hypothetical protein
MDELSAGEGRTPRPQCEVDVEALNEGEVRSTDAMRGEVSSNGDQDFRTKLQGLRIMRAELDEDIRYMERALSIMGGASP